MPDLNLKRADELGAPHDWNLRTPRPADGGFYTDPVSDEYVAQQLDITLSAVRDAVAGAGAAARTLGDVVAAVQQLETISLDAATLAALEGITATLDATSLAALENITVGGTVDLGNASLAALAKEVTLSPVRNRFAPTTPKLGDFASTGDHTIYTPTAGTRLRVTWLYAQAAAALDTGEVICTFKLGGTDKYKFALTGSQPWAHGCVIEGAVNEALVINTDTSARVLVDADIQEF